MNPNRPKAIGIAILVAVAFAGIWPNDDTAHSIAIPDLLWFALVVGLVLMAANETPSAPEPIEPCHFCGAEYRAGKLFRIRLSLDQRSHAQPVCSHCVREKRITGPFAA